ncbi:MAG: glycosyltransferase 87 family protein [Pseudomonadota bacterium]
MRGLWAIAIALLITTAALTALSWPAAGVGSVFGSAAPGGDGPIGWVFPATALMMLAGFAWMALPPAIRAADQAQGPPWRTLALILAVGFAMRLIFFASEPLWELDYHRYLWEGAAVNVGLNPYALSPAEARLGPAAGTPHVEAWRALAAAHPTELSAVTYDKLRSVYPPLAQAAFAAAHALEPFSLTALRAVFLLCELAALGLLALLLKEVGRPPSWIALYWWNPLVARELVCAAHMEAVLLPFLLAALLFAARKRWLAGAAAVALAGAVKLWPLALGALALRGAGWARFFAGAAMIGAITVLASLPILLGRLDAGSGFVAYAGEWERNAALFPALAALTEGILEALGLPFVDAAPVARIGVLLTVSALAALLALRPVADAEDLCRRCLIVIAAMFLLSPAAYPWYAVWFAPLLAVFPWAGLRLLMATLPLYTLRFWFVAEGDPTVFDTWIVWAQIGPVLLLLGWEAHRAAKGGRRGTGAAAQVHAAKGEAGYAARGATSSTQARPGR